MTTHSLGGNPYPLLNGFTGNNKYSMQQALHVLRQAHSWIDSNLGNQDRVTSAQEIQDFVALSMHPESAGMGLALPDQVQANLLTLAGDLHGEKPLGMVVDDAAGLEAGLTLPQRLHSLSLADINQLSGHHYKTGGWATFWGDNSYQSALDTAGKNYKALTGNPALLSETLLQDQVLEQAAQAEATYVAEQTRQLSELPVDGWDPHSEGYYRTPLAQSPAGGDYYANDISNPSVGNGGASPATPDMGGTSANELLNPQGGQHLQFGDLHHSNVYIYNGTQGQPVTITGNQNGNPITILPDGTVLGPDGQPSNSIPPSGGTPYPTSPDSTTTPTAPSGGTPYPTSPDSTTTPTAPPTDSGTLTGEQQTGTANDGVTFDGDIHNSTINIYTQGTQPTTTSVEPSAPTPSDNDDTGTTSPPSQPPSSSEPSRQEQQPQALQALSFGDGPTMGLENHTADMVRAYELNQRPEGWNGWSANLETGHNIAAYQDDETGLTVTYWNAGSRLDDSNQSVQLFLENAVEIGGQARIGKIDSTVYTQGVSEGVLPEMTGLPESIQTVLNNSLKDAGA